MAPQPMNKPGKELAALFEELQELWDLEDPLQALPRRLNPNRAKHAMDWPADIMLAVMAAARVTPGRHAYVVQRLEKRMDERLQHGRPNRAQHTIVEDLEYVARINPVRPREIPAMVHRNAPAQGAPAQAGNVPGGLLRADRHAKQIAKQRIASKSQGKRKRNGENEEPMSDKGEQENRKRARAGPERRRRRASSGSEQGDEEGRKAIDDGDSESNSSSDEDKNNAASSAPQGKRKQGDPRDDLGHYEEDEGHPKRRRSQHLSDETNTDDDEVGKTGMNFEHRYPIPPDATPEEAIELIQFLKKRNSDLKAASPHARDSVDSEYDYRLALEKMKLARRDAE